MKPSVRLMLVAASAAALAGAASAQPYGGDGRATLYEYPNFQGRSVTITRGEDDLRTEDFNDVAMSGRFDGDWSICVDIHFEGGCRQVAGEVRNFDQMGMGHTISSLRVIGGDRDDHHDHDDHGPAVRNDWPGGTAGRSAVFFPRPQSRDGDDIAANDRGAADWFCRQQGLDAAIYFDTREKSVHAFQWQGGGFAVNAPVLRDVLCRR